MRNKLEIRAMLEVAGYDEDEVDDAMSIYDELTKHIGFKDLRRDKRYIVKFHDIMFTMPDDMTHDEQALMDSMFDGFCQEMSDDVETQFKDKFGKWESPQWMLSSSTTGHYCAFNIYIGRITDENCLALTKQLLEEYDCVTAKDYVEQYTYIVGLLQDLENTYLQQWMDYVHWQDIIPHKLVEQIDKNYNKLIERNKKWTN